MKKVLIIEDDPMVALINRKYIELIEGFNVLGCSTTEEEVFEILQREKVDLIILDVYLPKKSGLEILKTLRDKMYLGDIIMVTAANSAEEVKTAFAYGVIDYLIKPFEFERFSEAINKYLAKESVLSECQGLKQDEIDTMCKKEEKVDIPKGLQKSTLEKIVKLLEASENKIWTIREISGETGISNVTVKKYMDYLVECKRLKESSYYGNVGRPEYKYIFLK